MTCPGISVSQSGITSIAILITELKGSVLGLSQVITRMFPNPCVTLMKLNDKDLVFTDVHIPIEDAA